MLPKPTSRAGRKRLLVVLAALLAVNAGVAHILIGQISIRTVAQTSVLGEESIAPEENQIVSGNANNLIDSEEIKPTITIYTVESGDTISGIAEKFKISSNTIRWANDLDKKATIKVGQELVILPITGIQHVVKSGDTISGISKKYGADADEILSFNDLEDAKYIKPGMKLIIPDAEPTVAPVSKSTSKSSTNSSTKPSTSHTAQPKQGVTADKEPTSSASSQSTTSGFINPAPNSVLTQGLHAVNAVDFGAKTGSPILAAAKGVVVVAKGSGAYNGGFGNFIVISHDNGIQTLYAHLSKVGVTVGDSVDAGDQIGLMGNTGKSTGSHLHFEVHGAKNPWVKDKKGSHY